MSEERSKLMKNNLVKTEIDVKNNKVGIMRIGE